ncbi:DUF4303 domain-containing protein [Breznakiellaceae bacterium SP9]
MKIPSSGELKSEIKDAVKNTVNDLFKINENFYYLVLITTEEGLPPILSAWSVEAFEKYNDNHIKWSYADSPYYNYGGKYFNKVNELFRLRPLMNEKMTNEEWNDEFNIRIAAMELALKELDEENIFERQNKNKNMVINVEVIPPNYENTKRALRLNKKEILKEIMEEWLEEEE